jgi:sugar/nucleoside kinase (ribokinase family)
VDLVAIQSSDVTVVGQFSVDSILLPSRSGPFVVLGGPVTYVSFATRHLGGTVSVISKVGGDREASAAAFGYLC